MQAHPDRWFARLENIVILWVVLLVGFGLLGLLATALMTFWGVPKGFGFGVPLFAPIAADTDGVAAEGAQVDAVYGVEVMARPQGDPFPLFGLLYLSIWAPPLAIGMLASRHLLGALRKAKSGNRALFSTATADHLRRLGWILIIGSTAISVVETASKVIVSRMLIADGYPFQPPSWTFVAGLAAGFLILGVAEIIRRGMALLDEVEATI